MNPSAAHLNKLDALRALAALSVCLFHFSTNSTQCTGLAKYLLSHCHLGVDAFFVISGFVIPLSLANSAYSLGALPNFLLRRLIRLYPAFLAAAALYLAIWYAASLTAGFKGHPFVISAKYLLGNATLTSAFIGENWIIPIFWTLAIEAQYYILIGLVQPLLLSSKKSVLILTILAWLALPVALPWQAGVFSFCALFGMGVILFARHMKRIGTAEFLALTGLAFLIQWSCCDLASAVVGLASSLFIAFGPESYGKPLMFVGMISYSLYLIHIPVGGRIMNFANRHPSSLVFYYSAMALSVAASLVFAYLFYLAIERPSHRIAQRFSKRRILPEK